ncbi:Thioredoxin domain-containing protein 9 [Perkinsus olseni]|uniref:Thioredoxin domain-containing protein 9 n=1 Tax=Perkinsus olseni TaxID=32597 RepID=A0A7J6PEX5_PEROL|nr:Thioredoxin domain-containing protein 9 [Perkinsus olseni]
MVQNVPPYVRIRRLSFFFSTRTAVKAWLDNLKEDDIEEIRRKRLEEMKEDYKASLAAKDSRLMVCHFYRPTTWRCQIVDKHLTVLAEKYIGTRFVKINAEKSPFLCDRFRIMMLPTMMLVKDGKGGVLRCRLEGTTGPFLSRQSLWLLPSA